MIVKKRMTNSYIEKNRWYITCSKLKMYMKSKEWYKKIYVDEIDTSIIKDSPSLEKGTMVDEYILSPKLFEQHYAFPAWSGKKDDLIKACYAKNIPVDKQDKVDDLKAKLYGNKQVLTQWEVEMLEGIKRELQRQPLFDFDWSYQNQKELVVEYKGHKLKGTLDRVSVEQGLIRDLKTTKDMEYSSYHECTWFEDKLIHNDQYRYWLQLAWYRVLCYINYGKEMTGIIDAIKASGNYAYEAYRYDVGILKKIANAMLFPALDSLIADTEKGNWDDYENIRWELINDRYYPLLDWAIQKDFREISPAFY